MRMLSVLAILAAPAAAAISSPALAEPETGSFKHEGYTYVYEVKEQGSTQLISGRRYPGAVPFSLRVRDGVVSGTSNGTPVTFDVSEAAGAAEDAEPVKIGMR